MPAGLTVFAASYLVYVAAAIAVAILAVRLWPLPRLQLLRWVVAAAALLALSYGLAKLGGALYSDPRPFTVSHVPPLIPHPPDNGFPSDHALLAAALVAMVALVDVWWSLPLVILAVLVDWARVGAGLHHTLDVAGSTLFVAVAAVIGLLIARLAVHILAPHLPESWNADPLVRMRAR
jgi:membrane-associated phospholipid phosphatase